MTFPPHTAKWRFIYVGLLMHGLHVSSVMLTQACMQTPNNARRRVCAYHA